MDEALWKVPATAEDVSESLTIFLTLSDMYSREPMTEAQKAVVTRMVASRGYTRAELLLALNELPFDHEASHRYRLPFNPADVERIVEKNRVVRRRLKQSLTRRERDELLAGCGDLDPACFQCCGFDSRNEPLYRYAPGVRGGSEPTPVLDED